jgi:hypothetical protein
MDVVIRYRDRVKENTLLPQVNWRSTRNPSSYSALRADESRETDFEPMQNARSNG